MIKINNKPYRIKRIINESHAGVRHITFVVIGDVREFNDKQVELYMVGKYDDEEFLTGTIILPHYCKDNNTTMFLVYVEEGK